MPGPAARLLEQCSPAGSNRDACSKEASAVYGEDSTRSARAASDSFALTAVPRWVWARQCHEGHEDSCMYLATTRRAADFPPSGADEEAVRLRTETDRYLYTWRQERGRKVLLGDVSEHLLQGQSVDVFKYLDDQALVSWGGPRDQWAWVPKHLLGSQADLKSVRRTRDALDRLGRRLDGADARSLVFAEVLRELSEVKPVLPEQEERKWALHRQVAELELETTELALADAEAALEEPLEASSIASVIGLLRDALAQARELETRHPGLEARLVRRIEEADRVAQEARVEEMVARAEVVLADGEVAELVELVEPLQEAGRTELASRVIAKIRDLERKRLPAIVQTRLNDGYVAEGCYLMDGWSFEVRERSGGLEVKAAKTQDDDGRLATAFGNLAGAGLGLKASRAQVYGAELLMASLCVADAVSTTLLVASDEGLSPPRWNLVVRGQLLQRRSRTNRFGNIVPLKPRTLRASRLGVSHRRLMLNNW